MFMGGRIFMRSSSIPATAPLPFHRRGRTGWLEERYFRVTSPLPDGIITFIRRVIEARDATKPYSSLY
jgi:hypothetical protein